MGGGGEFVRVLFLRWCCDEFVLLISSGRILYGGGRNHQLCLRVVVSTTTSLSVKIKRNPVGNRNESRLVD